MQVPRREILVFNKFLYAVVVWAEGKDLAFAVMVRLLVCETQITLGVLEAMVRIEVPGRNSEVARMFSRH